jgi:hypothetical protein
MPRKPKATRATEATPLDAAPAPARRGRPPRASKAMPKPSADEGNSVPSMGAADAEAAAEPNALMSEPAGAALAARHDADGAKPAEPTAPSPVEDAAAASKPAARWDPAADTVQFDWPEIEQTASRPGPNQVMAKLLVAARAEGANSRWPFQMS